MAAVYHCISKCHSTLAATGWRETEDPNSKRYFICSRGTFARCGLICYAVLEIPPQPRSLQNSVLVIIAFWLKYTIALSGTWASGRNNSIWMVTLYKENMMENKLLWLTHFPKDQLVGLANGLDDRVPIKSF